MFSERGVYHESVWSCKCTQSDGDNLGAGRTTSCCNSLYGQRQLTRSHQKIPHGEIHLWSGISGFVTSLKFWDWGIGHLWIPHIETFGNIIVGSLCGSYFYIIWDYFVEIQFKSILYIHFVEFYWRRFDELCNTNSLWTGVPREDEVCTSRYCPQKLSVSWDKILGFSVHITNLV